LKKLWFDAHVSGTVQKQLLIDSVGADRCVYGTNFGGWDTPAKADEFARSLTVNTERLLRLNRQ
jgi:aminocarboxymuconate-semialdehyde decarboxylase